jgi:RES domain-containing protein
VPDVTRDLWRISNYKSLTGEGGLKYAARWHSAGHRIVYLAESPAGALIEVLVHLELEQDELPRSYMLLRVGVPDDLVIEELSIPAGDGWKSNHTLSRKLGDEWSLRRETALARVPSAILPNTSNYLLNPLHADAKRIRIMESSRAEFDPRLLKHLRG